MPFGIVVGRSCSSRVVQGLQQQGGAGVALLSEVKFAFHFLSGSCRFVLMKVVQTQSCFNTFLSMFSKRSAVSSPLLSVKSEFVLDLVNPQLPQAADVSSASVLHLLPSLRLLPPPGSPCC